MLHFRSRIPITIYPLFWIFAALIGFLNSGTLIGTLVWVAIILVSVLFHEMGHALTASLFGQKPRIELVALGGLTYHDGQRLPLWKQFFIVFDGPLFGFILYLAASALTHVPALSKGMPFSILSLAAMVNLFWTIINLLPVMPLDGGQLLRIVLEKLFGVKGLRYTLIAGLLIAIGIALFFFVTKFFLVGALFSLLAYQSFDSLRRTRHLTESDRDDRLQGFLEQVEALMQEGKKEEALHLCETIRAQAKKGMIYELATQYLAFLLYEKGDVKQAYELLRGMRQDLAGDALCLLHRVAFEQKDFPLVIEIGGACFQILPSPEIAVRNALAHAHLAEVVPTVGWIQTAVDEGLVNVQEVLADPRFDAIRSDPAFQKLSADFSS
ncbi:MAG: site-2 protease family protein [Verrucomicrobia bacterium]|nr:site-2 protease family protein [Verrucomicrobiota bacterium]